MDSNLPATRPDAELAEVGTTAPAERAAPQVSQPIGVAFLPLALAAFVIVAFAIAAWTFLAAG